MSTFDPLTRPSKDEWGLAIAQAVATRGECTRRRIGAVIINHQKRQIFAGYNGAPPGEPSCLDGACPRGRHYPSPSTTPEGRFLRCACGKPWPCSDDVVPDSSYDSGTGHCIAIHAELNCLLDAGRAQIDDDCVMYISDKPCPGCERIIRGYLKRVVWPDGEIWF